MASSARPRPAPDGGRPPRSPRRLVLPSRSGGGGNVAGANFFGEIYNELKKVVWPTRQQTVKLSTIVIVASAAVGLMLGAFDWAFTQLMQRFLVPVS